MKRINQVIALLVPPLQDVLFMALFVGALLLGNRMLNTDGDLGRHLTMGQYILTSARIPVNDILSSTRPGVPRPPYEWLAQVLFAIAYRLLRLDGVVLLGALAISAAFLIVFVDSSRRSQAPILALFVTLVAAVASSLHWLARPHIFTFLFLAIWLLWLEGVRTQQVIRLWQFPLLMAVWVNTHGGFVFGFLAWGAYMAGWLWNTLRRSSSRVVGMNFLIAGGTSLAASMLTPALWHNWDAVLGNRSAYILSRTVETMPADFSTPGVWPFVFLLVLASLLLLLRRREAAAAHVFLLGGFAMLALSMARNIPLFAIVSAPILVEWLRQSLGHFSSWLKLEDGFAAIEHSLRGHFWSVFAVLASVSLFTYHMANTHVSYYQFSRKIFPVSAADWIENHPMQENMFNDFNWGGYLQYRLWPAQRVFIDSQSDFYGEDLVRRYEGIADGDPNWDAELGQYDVNWMIVPSHSGLAEHVRASPGWEVVYEDPLAVICVRK